MPLSLLCAQLHTVRRIITVYTAQQSDKYAAVGNDKGIVFMASWWNIIMKIFLFGVPMFFALYFGAEAVGSFMNSLPDWITNALGATGKLLPALGFAMTVNVIGRPQFLPFFLGGFFLAAYSGMTGIPLALMGLFIACLLYTSPGRLLPGCLFRHVRYSAGFDGSVHCFPVLPDPRIFLQRRNCGRRFRRCCKSR